MTLPIPVSMLKKKHAVLVTLAVAVAVCIVAAARYFSHDDCFTARCILAQNKNFSRLYKPKTPVYLNEASSAAILATDPAFKEDPKFRHMLDVLSQHTDKMKINPPPAPACAVVGNSQILAGSGYGAQIDSHDYVYRMNSAPTETFEEDVGKKTTHHIFSHVFASNYKVNGSVAVRPYGPDTYHVILPLQEGSQEEFNKSTGNHGAFKRFYVNLARGLNNKENPSPPLSFDNMAQLRELPNLVSLTPDFLWYVNNDWFKPKSRRPGDIASTGLVTLVMALHQCDKVDVYGFGPTRDGAWGKYFDDSKDRPKRHRPGYQEKLLERLQRSGAIRVHKGKCCEIRL